MKSKLFYLLTFFISLLYFGLRFNHFQNNFVFRPDQGLHLLESYDMYTSHHLRLLGPLVSSKNFDNRNFFIGGNYYYALSALGIIAGWNPLSLTVLYNIFEFFFILFFIFWLKKRFGSEITLIIFLFLSLLPYLISHSRFYWNPHFLLPLSILELYLLDLFLKNKKLLYLFLASLVWGCAFAFHYAAILWLIVFAYVLYRRRPPYIFSLPIIFLGFVIGDLPFFISEIRHSFYNLKTILFVYSNSGESSQLYGHYFIYPFLIFFLFIYAFYLKKYWSKTTLRLFLILALVPLAYLFPKVDELSAIPGWRYPDQLRALNFILASGCPQNYNVATTISGDTRSYDLRSLLTVSSCPPLPVEKYPEAKTIFLIAPPIRPPETETVWEISSFRPFKIELTQVLNSQVVLYRLSKNEN